MLLYVLLFVLYFLQNRRKNPCFVCLPTLKIKLTNIEMTTLRIAGHILVGYITCPTEAVAKALARGLIESRLAACANIIPSVTSIYRIVPCLHISLLTPI